MGLHPVFRTVNPLVVGSSPTRGANKSKTYESFFRLHHAACFPLVSRIDEPGELSHPVGAAMVPRVHG